MSEIAKGAVFILFVIAFCELFLIPKNASKLVGYAITSFCVGVSTLLANLIWGIPLVGLSVGYKGGLGVIDSSTAISLFFIAIGGVLYVISFWHGGEN